MTRSRTALGLTGGAVVGTALLVTALGAPATADAAPSTASTPADMQRMHELMGEGTGPTGR